MYSPFFRKYLNLMSQYHFLIFSRLFALVPHTRDFAERSLYTLPIEMVVKSVWYTTRLCQAFENKNVTSALGARVVRHHTLEAIV